MITKEQIWDIIRDKLEEDDVYIVDLSVGTGNQIYVSIDAYAGINISYCVDISRMIEGSFDRDEEDFELTVTTASLSEPFKVWRQYKKNEGKEVKVSLKDGQRLTGVMKQVEKDFIVLETSSRVKVEGKKKKQTLVEEHKLGFEQIKATEIVIKF